MSFSQFDGMKPRLLQDFILPALEQGTFKEKLCWVDRSQKKFKILWTHQSSSRFSPEDSCVYQHWAMAKGLWNPNEEKCFTKAKQRLRAALLKLKTVKCVQKEPEYRIYQIVSEQEPVTSYNATLSRKPLLENRPIYEYHQTETMEFPPDFIQELETEILVDYLLAPPDSSNENYWNL